MTFDWKTFFKKNNIHYVTQGRNTKNGEYSVSCPWCNKTPNPDPSQHLGINPKTGAYSCWRNQKHRGNQPVYLIMHLLHCSAQAARDIYGIEQVDPSLLKNVLSKLKAETGSVNTPQIIFFPDNFYTVKNDGSFKPYYNYLIKRAFEVNDIDSIIKTYDLRAAITGPYAGRLILPVTYQGKLVSWSGRAINDADGRLRYQNTGTQNSVIKQTDSLYLFDHVMSEKNKRTLYVLEGQFDALKLDYYGKSLGIRAVCMFTNNLSSRQKLLVAKLASYYEKVIIMLDTGWYHQAMSLARQITANNVFAGHMPVGYKDVGVMTKQQILKEFGNDQET